MRDITSAALTAALGCFSAHATAQAPLVDLLSDPSSRVGAPADEFVKSRVRVEIWTPRAVLFETEPLAASVRVWIESDFARSNLLQISARQLDVPVQVLAPWLERSLLESALLAPGGRRASVALGERVTEAARLDEREFEGRRYLGFELRGGALAERRGELILEAPRVRLAYATEFASTLLSDRDPLNGRVVVVEGALARLAVVPLPEDGRPLDFGGAIGRFELRAVADRDELRVDEPFRLTLQVRGEGNFGRFEPPRLDREPHFRVIGRLARPGPEGLDVTYDLAPTARTVFETPRIELAYFDPVESAYRVASAAPLPVRVRSRTAAAAGSASASTDPTAESDGRHPAGMRAGTSMMVLLLGALSLVAAVVGLGVWLALRARKRR